MTDGTSPPEQGMPHPSPVNPADPSNTASNTASDIVRISLDGLNGTGDSRVDEAVAQLGRLDEAPLAEHPAILGEVHDRLRDVLGELSPGDNQRAPGTP